MAINTIIICMETYFVQFTSATEEKIMESGIMEIPAGDPGTPVFSENENYNAITSPPPRTDRRPIPIATIDWQSTPFTQMIANQGIDFLRGVEQIYIQQIVELNDLMSQTESENRYAVKIPQGETLYYATESSSDNQRIFCGSNRAFEMKLFDHTQQLAITFQRSLACAGWSLSCLRHSIDVLLPHDDLIGSIKQEWSLSVPKFSVVNKYGSMIYRIEGPASWKCFMSSKESHFKIFSGDGQTQLGSINHVWDQISGAYNLSVQLPSRADDTKHKALLLGGAFLLEYMYFVTSKRSSYCPCCPCC